MAIAEAAAARYQEQVAHAAACGAPGEATAALVARLDQLQAATTHARELLGAAADRQGVTPGRGVAREAVSPQRERADQLIAQSRAQIVRVRSLITSSRRMINRTNLRRTAGMPARR